MKLLKGIIIATCIFFFIGHISLLSEDKWPDSFDKIKFFQKNESRYEKPTDVDIEECFENETIKYNFNLGYKGIRKDYSPIDRKYKQHIYTRVTECLSEVFPGVCNELKACSILNDIFGEQVQENLNSFPTTLYFKCNLSSTGTHDNDRMILKADYLLNFMYNAGKQLRESQGKKLNLTPADFYLKDGKPDLDSIQKTISHELTHHLTGLESGELLHECIVHCLTKKCRNEEHNLRKYMYQPPGELNSRLLECDKLSENQLNNISDKIVPQMGQPACFCDTDWKAIIQLVESEDCENPNPPGGENRGDTPDDNYSYSSGSSSASGVSNAASLSNLLSSLNVFPLASEQNFISYSYYPDILVYDKFNYPDLPGLLRYYSDFNNLHDYVHDNFSNNHRLLIIPSGELIGDENSIIIKEALKRFVESGGTLLVLSQQYNTQFENLIPIPNQEPFKCYGWRQDQSCSIGSTYFEEMHPVLSSSTRELVSAVVDGYFDTIPSTATTLLYKTRNRESTMLYYPYGNGTVILTSLYTDWAYAHSQATTAELRIISDLITFAKNPKLPIPMYDLEQNPTPSINLNVEIRNITETPASKAKLMVYTPDRNIRLYDLEVPVNLNPGETTQAAINFNLPELQTKDYGICHVDYELYNAENELIQLPTESDSGRFSIYKIITPVTIKDAVYMWVTVKDENVYWGQNAEFTIHFKNTTTETKTLDLNNPFFSIGHGGSEGPTFPSFQVILAPGEEYQHHVSLPTTQFNSFVKSSITVRIQYYDANGVLKQTGPAKTFFLLGTMNISTLKLNTLFKVVDTYYLYIDRLFQHNTNFKVSFGSLPQYSVNFGLSSGMLPQHSVNFTSSLGSLPEHSVKSVLPSGGLPQHNPNAASCPGTLPHHNLSSALSPGSLPHHVVNSEFLSGSISQQHLNQFFSQNRIIPVFEIAGGLISC